MKRILSLFLALCMICTLLPATALTASAADGKYVKVDLAEIQSTDIVLITVTKKDGNTYAMSNDKGTSNGPAPVLVTITDNEITSNVTDNIKWNITNSGGNLTIYPNGTTAKWLYCTSTNNGVRVGTNANKVFTIDASSGYLKNTATSRYLGVYNTQDWRCYTSPTTANIANQTLAFYKWVETVEPTVTEATESSCEHENVTTTVTKNPTCTATGEEVWECDDCGETGTNILEIIDHSMVDVEGKDATCTESGLKSGQKCTVCGYTVQDEIDALGHNYVDGKCSCGAEEPNEVVFELGANGAAIHKDGSTAQIKYSETVGDYTLNIIDGDKMYPASYDAKGNSCIKLGTGSTHGSFKFTVPDDVVSIKIAVAKYKENTTDITVNETIYSLTKNSNDGEYDEIVVDTSSDKTIILATTSSYKRAMVNSITFVFAESGEITCEHTNTEAIGEAKDATCTEDGITAGKKCSDCGVEREPQETIPATGHYYVDGVCSCGDKVAVYQLVTDVIDLQIGDKIVIVSTASDAAMGADKETYRSETIVTKNGNTVFVGADVQIVTLEKGAVDGTFAFNTGNGYLYVPSTGTNPLYTGATIDKNGSWKIEVVDGVTKVTAQSDDNEDNQLQYNKGSNRFSCYDTKQGAISIYKLPTKVAEYTPAEGGEPVSYTSWAEALKNTAGTLVMFADLVAGEVNPDSNLVLDLNGYTLNVTTIDATVKDSRDGQGLIITPNKAKLASVDGQMILWDNNASGFRVYNTTFNDAGMNLHKNDTDLAKSFWSDLDFDESYAYQLVASTNSGLNIGFKLKLNGTEKTCWLSQEEQAKVMKEWGNKKYSNKNTEIDYFFFVTVTGFSALQEGGVLEVTPVAQDYYGNVIEADVIKYQFVVG